MKRIDPETLCMHEAGTANSCEAVATRFHERPGQSTDEILCDAHAVGKKTEPLTEPFDALYRVRTIIRSWDQADMDANVAYFGDANLGTRPQAETTRLLNRLSNSGGQSIDRPAAVKRCAKCDGLEMKRRGWDESGPERPDRRTKK